MDNAMQIGSFWSALEAESETMLLRDDKDIAYASIDVKKASLSAFRFRCGKSLFLKYGINDIK